MHRTIPAWAAGLALIALPMTAWAQDATADDQLERELARELAPDPTNLLSAAPRLRLIDISWDALMAAGGTSIPDRRIPDLQPGGHDPRQRGMSIQNLEISLQGAADPYFDGEAHLIYFLDRAGESVMEVEEAFLTTRELPAGLELKAGQYFTEFGRLNPRHPHAWNFVDQPLILNRIFGGDGLRNPGARLSWLTPLPWYSEVLGGCQQAGGETAPGFLGQPFDPANPPGPNFTGHTPVDRPVRSLEDFVINGRWVNGLDLSRTISLNLGASMLSGPNATGLANRTEVYGADGYLKWKPLKTDGGWPFVAWQGEYLRRRYEAGDRVRFPREVYGDWGHYQELLVGFARRWTAGLRYDYAEGEKDDPFALRGRPRRDDPARAPRWRWSPSLSFFPTEFSKIRVQYNRDQAHAWGGDETAEAIWLQVEILFGSHPAHKF